MNPEDSDRRQQILDAALRVIAQQGFHKASIKLIAKEAQLKSPALIYWYFKDKNDLLRAIVYQHVPLLDQIDLLETLFDIPPQEVLPALAQSYLQVLDNPQTLHLFRVVFSELNPTSDIGAFFAENILKKVLGVLEGYFTHQVSLGRLRPHDTASAARAFMGMWVIYLVGYAIIPGQRELLPPRELYIKNAVEIFLQGLGEK